jgi:Mrp family chromosome partitioning ATPase
MVMELADEFDKVIFDSPPLGVVTDASILARVTDATMLVAKAGRTSKHALARAKRQLGTDVYVLAAC